MSASCSNVVTKRAPRSSRCCCNLDDNVRLGRVTTIERFVKLVHENGHLEVTGRRRHRRREEELCGLHRPVGILWKIDPPEGLQRLSIREGSFDPIHRDPTSPMTKCPTPRRSRPWRPRSARPQPHAHHRDGSDANRSEQTDREGEVLYPVRTGQDLGELQRRVARPSSIEPQGCESGAGQLVREVAQRGSRISRLITHRWNDDDPPLTAAEAGRLNQPKRGAPDFPNHIGSSTIGAGSGFIGDRQLSIEEVVRRSAPRATRPDPDRTRDGGPDGHDDRGGIGRTVRRKGLSRARRPRRNGNDRGPGPSWAARPQSIAGG